MEHGDQILVHKRVAIVKVENVIDKLVNVLLEDVMLVFGVTIVFNNVIHVMMDHVGKILVNAYVQVIIMVLNVNWFVLMHVLMENVMMMVPAKKVVKIIIGELDALMLVLFIVKPKVATMIVILKLEDVMQDVNLINNGENNVIMFVQEIVQVVPVLENMVHVIKVVQVIIIMGSNVSKNVLHIVEEANVKTRMVKDLIA